MALMEIVFPSEVLTCQNEIRIFLPDHDDSRGQYRKYKTIWMLHGGNGDCHEWYCHSSLFREAEKNDYAIVLLSVYNSFGMDMNHGGKYATFLEQEVMPAVWRMLPCLSRRKEDNVAAGVSMGGFAAVRWAMNRPDRFFCCAAFAGALAMPIIYQRYLEGRQPGGPDFDYSFGSVKRITGNENDILHMAKKNMENGTMIPLDMICGEDDFGFDLNDYMQRELIKLGVDVSFYPVPGEHNFDCWEPHLSEFFGWLKRKERC